MQLTVRRHTPRALRIVLASALVIATALGVAACSGSDSTADGQSPSTGSLASIIGDSHVHSLSVDRADPNRLWIGLHSGLYVSADAGRSWSLAGLDGDDSMNIAGAGAQAPLWVAGHEVLERSVDGGATWQSVRPAGLPGLDLHGFAVRPGQPEEILAAVAGQGLYGSRDGGASFELRSTELGPSVFGMALTADGTLFAADPTQGLFVSNDGGRRFRAAVQGGGIVSVAAVPRRPLLALAAGDPGVIVSRDGGDLWETAFADSAIAAVAIDPADPSRAYAVGNDGTLYTTDDAARTWSAVPEGA